MDIHNYLLGLAATALVSSLASLYVFDTYLLPSKLEQSRELVNIISKDMASSRLVGSYRLIDTCKEKGEFTLPATNESDIVYIDCKNIKVKPADTDILPKYTH